MTSRPSWWGRKVRQFRSHLRARVAPTEREGLATWLTPDQLAVFDSMHVADQRHGLDVAASLRATGPPDPELLLAGLLHDAGKGDVGVWPRVAFALGQRYGSWVWRIAAVVPGWRASIGRLHNHAEASAKLAAAAGCSIRTVALIRHQDAPEERDAGERLRLADEAN